METVIRQDCAEIDLRTGSPLPMFIPITQYERKDKNTFIAYCDHKSCNTKDFIETSMKESSKDEWILIGSSQGTYMFFMLYIILIYLLKYG